MLAYHWHSVQIGLGHEFDKDVELVSYGELNSMYYAWPEEMSNLAESDIIVSRNKDFLSLSNSLVANDKVKYANLDLILNIWKSPIFMWTALSAVSPQNSSTVGSCARRAHKESFHGLQLAHRPYI